MKDQEADRMVSPLLPDDTLFSIGPRQPGPHASFGESTFKFLDRSDWPHAYHIRALFTTWLDHVHPDGRHDLMRRLRSRSLHLGAFWELYLHEAYRRSGFTLIPHPEVPGTSHRPDFLVTKTNGKSFYLEATTAQLDESVGGAARRYEDLLQCLREMQITNFHLRVDYRTIGPSAISAKYVRRRIKGWLKTLDVGLVADGLSNGGQSPSMRIEKAGWDLTIRAHPRSVERRSVEMDALGRWKPFAEVYASDVDKVRDRLEAKHRWYGPHPIPLVLAVLSNLGGIFPDPATGYGALFGADKFWGLTHDWRRSRIPQVIVASGITNRALAAAQVVLWQSPEPGVPMPEQPDWLSLGFPGPDGFEIVDAASPLGSHMQIKEDWLAARSFEQIAQR